MKDLENGEVSKPKNSLSPDLRVLSVSSFFAAMDLWSLGLALDISIIIILLKSYQISHYLETVFYGCALNGTYVRFQDKRRSDKRQSGQTQECLN